MLGLQVCTTTLGLLSWKSINVEVNIRTDKERMTVLELSFKKVLFLNCKSKIDFL
jgi:hypothetical protein